MLVIFSGGSGVGKNTVIAELLKTGAFALMPTYTTREKRPNESEGNPYCFVDEKTFLRKVEEGELYEHENVHGHYYGTSRILLKEKLALGKILLKDIDVLGTQNLVKSVGKDVKIVALFLQVDSKQVLIERLTERKEQEIEKRLARYEMEMSYRNYYDYVINNYRLEETVKTVQDIIEFEKRGGALDGDSVFADELKIADYCERLNAGERLEPIKIAFRGGKAIIVDGVNKYLASVATKKRVAKKIVGAEDVRAVDEKKWRKTLKKYI